MASLEDLTVSVSIDFDVATKALDTIAKMSDRTEWPSQDVGLGDYLAAVHQIATEALDKVRVSMADDRMADALAHERQRSAAILRKMYRHYDGHAIAEAIIEGKVP